VKRFLAQPVLALCALSIIFLFVFAHIGSASADDLRHRHQYKHHPLHEHLTYRECRVGWWQTLYYGHVRPRWEVWCSY
jgi:hypothetical protein